MDILEFKQRNNTHQTHMEDLVILGQDGLDELNDKIEKFISIVEDNLDNAVITQKIDGAPALLLYSKLKGYPDYGIGIKSLLNNPANAVTSIEQINAKYADRQNMSDMMKYGLELCHSIPAGEVWQGDCLFGKKSERTIDGTKYITFHPNKIVYAFSEDNDDYDKVKNANFGIALHTIYKQGDGGFTQSFKVDIDRLSNVPSNIFILSPTLNVSKAQFNLPDIKDQYKQLLSLENDLISSEYEELVQNKVFIEYWNTFENANLSDKKAIHLDVNTFYDDLLEHIRTKMKDKFDKKMTTLKTDKGRDSARLKYDLELASLEDVLNKDLLTKLVKCLNAASDIKMSIWSGLKQIKNNYNQFYEKRSGEYISTSGEGYSLSDLDGNIVKIVNRAEFSAANRDTDFISGFEHD